MGLRFGGFPATPGQYYPFGHNLRGTNPIQPDPGYNYAYNGKEKIGGTGLYAYGFRYYDPLTARFTGVDPISDQFAHVSVYNYAENSPVRFIDLHGLQRAEPVSGVKGPWSNEYVNRELTDAERDQIRNRLGGQHETVIADLNKRHQVESLGAFADASAVLFDMIGMADAGVGLLDDAVKYGNRLKNSIRSGSRANSAVMSADDVLSNFSTVERGAIQEADGILHSSGMESLRSAFQEGKHASVRIGNRTVMFEPDIPMSSGISAMTLDDGFVLSARAFSSSDELAKSVLQEVHRLNFSVVVKTGSINPLTASSSTRNAFEFAEEAYKLILR